MPFFILQDANHNVMAVTDSNGAVLEQYTYAPYGEILAVDHPQGSPGDLPFVNRTGHQGLFNDRLGSALESTTGPIILATPVLTPEAVGLYYNRNRYYSPHLGRFTQRDPNETALPILIALASNGEAMDSLLSGISPHDLYGDGMNLYLYVGSNPVNARDAFGLYVDAFQDDIDALIDDLIGHRVAALGFINEGSGWVLFGTNTAVSIAGSLLGVDLLQAGRNILHGQGSFWDYVEVGAAATGAGYAAWKAFKWAKRFNRLRPGSNSRAFLAGSRSFRRFKSWLKGLETSQRKLNQREYDELVDIAKGYNLKVGVYHRGHLNTKWPHPHIKIDNKKISLMDHVVP